MLGFAIAATPVVLCRGTRLPQWLLNLRKFNLLLLSKVSTLLKYMKTFTAIIERDIDTNLYVGYVPGFPGAHSQGETLDELQDNLREVIEMLLEDEHVSFNTQFIGTQQIVL